jgi:cytochrome c-type biogenesis protein CcmH/NrfG
VTLLVALGFFAAFAVVLRPLMSALGRRLEGRPRDVSPDVRAELDQLRHRLEELEAVPGRVLELEERLDFAERLLAQRRDAERLERGAK